MTDKITFYTNPQSRGRTVRWMLEEIGVPYETVVLDFATTMKAPDYLAINPMGKVPAIRHGKTVVTEVAAILTYLAETFPAAGLVGTDKGAYYRWLYFVAGPLEYAFVDDAMGFAVPADKEGMIGYGTLKRALDTLEGAVTAHTWLAGERFSAADLYAGGLIGWILRSAPLTEFPGIHAYFDRIKMRPALARANNMDNALATQKG
ncbi:glutathione S-transferase GST-4.5 [mine drainage metagenome]|uniref:Glutathione S-transferase GST-4.5 n=1 Tax=mine drainage metagenome TaxID=410659 RepID=A0A1J5Q316_9ZZZZ